MTFSCALSPVATVSTLHLLEMRLEAFHLLATLHHIYAIVHLLSVNYAGATDSFILAMRDFGLRYLTTWNLIIQSMYFAACTGEYVLRAMATDRSSQFLKTWQKLRETIFQALIFPMGLVVFSVFWTLYKYDRSLVYPEIVDEYVAPHVNHMMHTNVGVVVVLEILLRPHYYRSTNRNLAILRVFSCTYLACYTYTYWSQGIWLYPLYHHLSWTQRIALSILVTFNVPSACYLLGEVIANSLWAEALKGQWKNLKDSYSRHLKSKKTHTGQAAQKYQHWQWAKHMEFLKPHLAFAKTNTNVKRTATLPEESAERQEQQPYDKAEGPNSPDISPTSELVATSPAVVIASTSGTPPVDKTCEESTGKRLNTSEPETFSSVLKKRPRNTTQSTSTVDRVVNYLQSRTDVDAVDHLFLSWAKTVKTFSPRRPLQTKMKISNIIMQQEAEELDEAMMNHAPSHSSEPSYDASATTSRASPPTPENMSPQYDTFPPQKPQTKI